MPKPEIAKGIGSWLFCIELLGKIAIVLNIAQLIFTSLTMQFHFTYDNWTPGLESHETHNHGGRYDTWINFSFRWDMVYYVFLMVAIEHLIFIVKETIEQLMLGENSFVKNGKRDRKLIINSFILLFKHSKKKNKDELVLPNERDHTGKFRRVSTAIIMSQKLKTKPKIEEENLAEIKLGKIEEQHENSVDLS